LACRAFSTSETCYRYEAKLRDENELIAELLIALTTAKRTWGFGLCFLHLRNVKGFGWNHKRVYRIYRELELNMLDDFNREGFAIEVDFSLPAERVVRTLTQIIAWRGKPLAIRVDNGPEYVSGRLQTWAEKAGIALLYIQPGKPQQNAYVERYNRTVRTEWLGRYHFESI
jgi:putative transposase